VKYMGSKRWQLKNGLGKELNRVVRAGDTFVDLFAGSGAVSKFIATNHDAFVTSVDLQNYSSALSGAVIERTKPVNVERLIEKWLRPLRESAMASEVLTELKIREQNDSLTDIDVRKIRTLASESDDPFVRHYGGHYFSIGQARQLSELRKSLPSRAPHKRLSLAALISAASKCSASPGHTAQPFQPTPKALPHIASVWSRDLISEVESNLYDLNPQFARNKGRSLVADANDFVEGLVGNEVVFVDPPYSAAQYSRFYHVLEAVAINGFAEVSGAGRSPSLDARRRSDYSTVSGAENAFKGLLKSLGERGCRVIITFPEKNASNGIEGSDIADWGREWFEVSTSVTSATFSTLGGNGDARSARHQTNELIITMFPKS